MTLGTKCFLLNRMVTFAALLLLLAGCEESSVPPVTPYSAEAQMGAQSAWHPSQPQAYYAPPPAAPWGAAAPAPPPPSQKAPPYVQPAAAEVQPLAPEPTQAAHGTAQTELVVHQADLHGRLQRRAGERLFIEPLVSTSSTKPAKGNRGGIYRQARLSDDETEWRLVADVEVAATLSDGASLEVLIVDEKEDARGDGEEDTDLFAPGTPLMLRWEW
jgi:hypothetical protein